METGDDLSRHVVAGPGGWRRGGGWREGEAGGNRRWWWWSVSAPAPVYVVFFVGG